MARELPLLTRTRAFAGSKFRGGSIEEPSQKIVRTHLAMRLNFTNNDKISNRAKLLACALMIAVAVGGCSSKSSQNQSEHDEFASKSMSPEQCAANASIEESAQSVAQRTFSHTVKFGKMLVI